jgi:hypothetical protein
MLCVIRGEHLEAVQGDFVHPDLLRTFDLDQVAFVYGSRYKETVSEHTYHAEIGSGSQWTACQMSLIEQTIKAPTSRPHTFRFISPLETGQSGLPNPCTSCHAGKSNAWPTNALRQWSSISPWRVMN